MNGTGSERAVPHPLTGRVLVAEDDRFYRQILAKRLRAAGHTVSLTENGLEAWSSLLADPPEVLLSDWMMPALDGFELCRRVKQDPVRKAVYVILLTAKDRTADKVAALDTGADDYLVKPCEDSELLARIRAGLRVHRMQIRLRESSETDALTGLRNRRYFDQWLGEEVVRSRRYHTPLCLILVDLDGFKEVNDRFGHPAGDRVLVEVGQVLRERIRGSDVAARIGGDEFAVLLPNTPLEGAQRLAAEVEEGLARIEVCLGDAMAVHTSGSAGCAELGQEMDAASLLRAADESLYARKQQRRAAARPAG